MPNRSTQTQVGLGYIDDCLILALNYITNYAYSGSVSVNHTYMMQVSLRTLGGSASTNSGAAGYGSGPRGIRRYALAVRRIRPGRPGLNPRRKPDQARLCIGEKADGAMMFDSLMAYRKRWLPRFWSLPSRWRQPLPAPSRSS